MDSQGSTPDRSIVVRDAAIRRLRWLRLAAGVIATAAMGVVAAVTAASTHTRVLVAHTLGARAAASSGIVSVPEPAATVSVSSGVSASGGSSSGVSSASSTPATASSAPVAVSGGS
jgi:hypothetical protein